MKTYSLIIATLLLSACSTVKSSRSNTVDVHVNNIVWSVISFKGVMLKESDFGNGLPRVSFNMQDGKISGTDGCNSFVGVASYRDNNIKTGAIASTKMACTGKNIQADFYETLSLPNLSWQFDDNNNLKLMADGLEVMVLKERE